MGGHGEEEGVHSLAAEEVAEEPAERARSWAPHLPVGLSLTTSRVARSLNDSMINWLLKSASSNSFFIENKHQLAQLGGNSIETLRSFQPTFPFEIVNQIQPKINDRDLDINLEKKIKRPGC